MFLGMDMCSGRYAMTPQYLDMGTTTSIQLADGTYDHLYFTANPDKKAENINDRWDADTKLNADYNDSLDGGNSGFSLKNTDTIIVKRREKGTMDWLTIFTIPINQLSDFNFVKEYYYGQAETDYDFMFISSIGGVCNAFEFSACSSEFQGICIADKEHFYKTIYNIQSTDLTKNTSAETVHLLNSIYPVIVSNDDTNYCTGTITAVFLKQDGCSVMEGKPTAMYRKEIMDWLTNKKAKMLKFDNGAVKMVHVVGNPAETDGGHREVKNITFEFAEIGNPENESDLYKANLSDVEPGRW